MGFDVHAHEFAQDLLHAARRRRAGRGAGRRATTRLMPFLPMPMVEQRRRTLSLARTEADLPQSIGRLSAFDGQRGRAVARVCVCAPARARRHAPRRRVRHAERQLSDGAIARARVSISPFRRGAPATNSSSRCKQLKDETGVTAMDFAKRLLDYGFHAPTTYFPLLVPECLLIEPTETESKANARCLRRSDDRDPATRRMTQHRTGENRAAHHAGAPPRRRQSRARNEFGLAGGLEQTPQFSNDGLSRSAAIR